MKYIIATIKPVIALVLCLSTSITVADGRDAGASAYTTSGHGYSDPLRWSDKGYAGSRCKPKVKPAPMKQEFNRKLDLG